MPSLSRFLKGRKGQSSSPSNSEGSSQRATAAVTPKRNALPDRTITAQAGARQSASATTLPSRTTHGSTPLWTKAFEQVCKTEDWQKYCEIVGQEPSASHLNPATSASASPNDILEIVATVKDKIEESQTSFKLGGRTIVVRNVCDSIIGTLSAVKDAGASLAGLNPYASMAWSGLQFVVQTIATAKEVRNMCWEVLPRATYLISRYQTLELLYVSDDGLQQSRSLLEQAQIELFVLILEYQMTVVIFLNTRLQRIKTSFGKASESKLSTIWVSIKDKEASLSGLQALADREIDNKKFLQVFDSSADLKSTLDQTWDEVQGISQVVDDMQRERILDWISDIKYENAHNEERRIAIANTGHWLLNHDAFLNWLSCAESSSFWLSGFMGSGKSCLAHVVIEHIRATAEPNNGQHLAYFYIDGNEARGASDYISRILRCLLKQLADSGPRTKLATAITQAYQQHVGKSDLTEIQCMELLQQILDDNNTTFLILDGLDECDIHGQRRLMPCLFHLLSSSKSKLKIFFSNRPTILIGKLMDQFSLTVVEIAQYNTSDIEELIDYRVKESVEDLSLQYLYRQDDEDQTEIVVRTLRSNAQGMFRWVHMAFDHLHSSGDFWTMQDRLEDLPRLNDLFDLYDRVYDDMMIALSPRRQAALRMTLIYMLHSDCYQTYASYALKPSRRFDKLDPLERFLGSQVKQVIAAAAYASAADNSPTTYETENILSLSPSFIYFQSHHDSAYAKFQFAHFSVREYLVERRKLEYGPRAGYSYLAKECLNIFVDDQCYSRAKEVRDGAFIRYAAASWCELLLSLRQCCGSWDDIFCDKDLSDLVTTFLLKSPAPTAFVKWHSHLQNWHAEGLLGQAIAYHSRELGFVASTEPSTMFARLLLDLQWKDSQFSRDLLERPRLLSFGPKWSTLHQAAALHDTAALAWLISQKVDVNVRIARNETVFVAVFADVPGRGVGLLLEPQRGTDADTVRTLLKSGAIPRQPKPRAAYVSRHPDCRVVIKVQSALDDTLCDLDNALERHCSTEAAILLFEDGVGKLDAARDWYLYALWSSAKIGHRFQHWLLQRYSEYLPEDTILCENGIPASKYVTSDSWFGWCVESRRRFITLLAAHQGDDTKDSEQGWDLALPGFHRCSCH